MAQKANQEMPFLDHLEELRGRMIWILGALAVGVGIAFTLIVGGVDVIGILMQPIEPLLLGQKLVYTHPSDPFWIVMTASFAIGSMFALPVILYQVWAFLSPALYSHEKRVVIPVIFGATLLFLAGAALSFYVILPFTLRFLLGFQTESLAPMITVRDYFGFAISMSLALGAIFELPIAIVALTALGLVTPQLLNKYRRHAAVLCIVAAAFITPGADPTSLFVMTIPLYLLFEVSVGLSVLVYRRKLKRAAATAAAEAEQSEARA